MDIMLTGAVRMVPSTSSGMIFLLSLGFCRSCDLMYSQIFFTTCDTSILSICIAVAWLHFKEVAVCEQALDKHLH